MPWHWTSHRSGHAAEIRKGKQMKPIDQWGSPEIYQITASRAETPEERARRLEDYNAMRENVTSPTPRFKPRGIDWGIAAFWAGLVLLGIAFWAWFLATFTSILGG